MAGGTDINDIISGVISELITGSLDSGTSGGSSEPTA